MKEAEFRALLALEGLELDVDATYFRTWDLDSRSGKRHTSASIVRRDADGFVEETILRTDYVQRRDYAVKSLAKRYYSDRG